MLGKTLTNINRYPTLTKEQNALVRSQCANRKKCPKNSQCNPGCYAPIVYFFKKRGEKLVY